jgi:hypothetical protein
MTGCVVGAVNEHRPNRRGEWIAHRQFFESVIADKVLGGVLCQLALRINFCRLAIKNDSGAILTAGKAGSASMS